jgi:hypothetical protein
MRQNYRMPTVALVVIPTLLSSLVILAETAKATAKAGEPRIQEIRRSLPNPEEEALLEIRKESRRRVREIVEQLRGVPEGPARWDLERRAMEIKREYRQRFLDTKAAFARAGSGGATPRDSRKPATANAASSWPSDGIPVCTLDDLPGVPSVTEDGAGGVYIAWQNGWAEEAYLQRISAAGAPAPGWAVNGIAVAGGAPGDQGFSGLAADGSGGALVAYQQYDPVYADWDVYVQRVTASGAVASGWPTGGVGACVWVQNQNRAAVTSDGSWGAILAWRDNRNTGNWEVYVRRVDAAGSPQWASGGLALSSGAVEEYDSPLIVSDGLGGAYVVWIDETGSSTRGIFIQRVVEGGTVAPGWPAGGRVVMSSGGVVGDPTLEPDGLHGAIVAWHDNRVGGVNTAYASRYLPTGSVAAGWVEGGTAIGPGAGANQTYPRLAPDGEGGALLAWIDERNSTDGDIYAQHVLAAAGRLWAQSGIPLTQALGIQANPRLVPDGAGGVLVVWSDYRNYLLTDGDIYGQHVTGDGRLAFPQDGLRLCSADGRQSQQQIAFVGSQNAIVAFDDGRSTGGSGGEIYAQYINGLSNLDATFIFPGWDAPAVPRDALVPPGGQVRVPATIEGNLESTFLNFGVWQAGPNPLRPWSAAVIVDGSWDHGWEMGIADNNFPDTHYVQVDQGPTIIRGGRHSLSIYADPFDLVPESDEGDNLWEQQWVWSPLELRKNIPVVRSSPPPPPGPFVEPNCDGMQFTRTDGFAWVSAMVPHSSGDDYDLIVYDDYAGSTSGFSNRLGSSVISGGFTDFVIGHRDATPLTVYPAVELFVAIDGETFGVDQSDSDGHCDNESGSFLGMSLAPSRLADVFEAHLNAGGIYDFVLERLEGPTDLRFAVYPPTPGGVWNRGHADAAVASQVGADIDTLRFMASTTGWHPIVVCRSDGAGVQGSGVRYDFTWSPPDPVDVPEPSPAAFTLAFHGAMPNPMTETTRIHFDLAKRGPVRLGVFDLRGRRVRALLNQTMEAGRHAPVWDGRGDDSKRVGSGIYWVRLEAAAHLFTKRLAVIR